MAGVFQDKINYLRKLNLLQVAYEAMQDSELQEIFIEAIQDQLQEGKDGNNQKIKTIHATGIQVYSDKTIGIKEKKGQRTDVVTLFDEGDFYRSMKIKLKKAAFEVVADFRKGSGNIMDNFTDDYEFLKPQDDTLSVFVDKFLVPKMITIIKNGLR